MPPTQPPAQPPTQPPTQSPSQPPTGGPRTPAPDRRRPRTARRWNRPPWQVRVLDPATAPVVAGRAPAQSTAYVGPRVIFPKTADRDRTLAALEAAAESLGWRLVVQDEDPRTRRLDYGVVVVDVEVAEGTAVRPPDGFLLLQQARALSGAESVASVGLDHVLHATTGAPTGAPAGIDSAPLHHSDPMTSDPLHHSDPLDAFPLHHSDPATTYVYPGQGGRQPVAVVAPPPRRRPDDQVTGRRPVVGILDTGCWTQHPWLTGVVRTDVTLGPDPIGYTLEETAPELHGDQAGPLDGVLDELSGHGTFIAGLVHQICPDADLLAWRVVPSQGPIVESDLVSTLAQVAELARRYRAGEPDGHPLDVLNLSMGYYHEDESDADFDPIMLGILQILADNGVAVVASAGNEATSRPCYPAAFSLSALSVPVVSVGALNPNGVDALFSNVGHWVTTYQTGAAVVSTMPPYRGGLEPVARTRSHDRMRESLDPDDFTGGFGVWSGTSFSAPIAAGILAQALLDTVDAGEQPDSAAQAVEVVRAALGCFATG